MISEREYYVGEVGNIVSYLGNKNRVRDLTHLNSAIIINNA